MSTNKILVTGLIAGVVHFFLGFLIWGVLLADFFAANSGKATGVSREEPVFWAIIVSSLAFGILLAYIFGKWASISTLATGASAGAVIGLLLGVAYDFMLFGTTHIMNMTGTVVDIIVTVAVYAILGAVVGWLLGRAKEGDLAVG